MPIFICDVILCLIRIKLIEVRYLDDPNLWLWLLSEGVKELGAMEVGAVARPRAVGDCIGSIGYQIRWVAMGATGAKEGKAIGVGGAGGVDRADKPAWSVLSWSST